MQKIALLFLLCLSVWTSSFAQKKTKDLNVPNRPKLVVGIVVDQMRWDYLYRFYDRYAADGGFKRFLQQGFTCENTLIPYTPTYTACGHTCLYTGTVPAIHGIAGNSWFDNDLKRSVYCTEDNTVQAVGGSGGVGQQSPRNMQTGTISDELRLATNFRSKVIGIALKDRGGILPAGHSANAAYWYDSRTGNFITSTYYMNELPDWVKAFNDQKLVDKYYAQGWNTLYPIDSYVQSTADEKPYEGKPLGSNAKGFPYDLSSFVGKSYGQLSNTPYGNTLTAEMAKAAIINEQLGADDITDLLAVSFSSPDYIGHSFGPNSIEAEDNYLRLDKELGDLFKFLDSKIGKGQYVTFLSADHGVAHVPGFMKENKLVGGTVSEGSWRKALDSQLQAQFGVEKLITAFSNYQVHLDHQLIDSLKLDEAAIKKTIVTYLRKQEGIATVVLTADVMTYPLPERMRNMMANGYYARRSGDVQYALKSNHIDGGGTGTTHGQWYPYDAHIPLLFYGWKIKHGKTNRETHMTDLAATLAALLHIQQPSGSIGDPILEVLQ
ncbi:MAG: alkaline phosphatase family protein [Candidatus Pseudobacter hemicellulosilyticus]|uniref:Alkaline phosphatase family protein n=1 Tax=Candidatus Pseudobacter hemicellulosilyticus TaxID=3121375 RepID=A0AAJ5WVT8_9BACT|nr:MAG: alkaline phosphatase family protein [Pseudobacter sp.]